mgnify:CR=1 FL=1
MTSQYRQVCEASHEMGERNDCTVKAIAIVTRLPYALVHEVARRRGRIPQRGLYCSDWLAVLGDCGFTHCTLPGSLHGYKVKTIISAKKWLAKNLPYNRALVWSTRHVAAWSNCQIQDSRTHSRHKVHDIILVEFDGSRRGQEARANLKTIREQLKAEGALV